MPDQPATERTEQPTPRRLQKARSKGNVPQINELMSVATLLALIGALAIFSGYLANWSASLTREAMSCQTQVFASMDAFISFLNAKIIDSMLISLPILVALAAGAIFAGLVVIGPNLAPGAIQLRFNAITPGAGIQQLLDGRSAVKLLVSILKFIRRVILRSWMYLSDKVETMLKLRWAWSGQIITVIAQIIFGLCIRVCIALLALAVAETFYQKWRYIQDLKMTRQEIKQELRDTEGAPEVKARIRRIQIQMSMKRMMQEVPEAKVVLVNPTHVAVALKYEPPAMDAPVVVAKGADHVAEKIMEIARAYGVPIIRRPELARTIFATVQLDKPIPQNLYVAVAEVLAMLHRLQQRRK